MASQSQAGYPRTSSGLTGPPASQYNMAQQQQQQYSQHTRRTPSNATSSSSTSTNTGLQRAPTNSAYSTSSAPRRSTSSRSTGSSSPTSYVALMRKQKATVWCDRAQHEDPRILAAQRAAKMRAAMEVAGGHHNTASSMRTSTSSSGMVGGVRSKIRHHGAPKASTYTGGPNLGGVGVPMRLSASEVDEGDSDEEGNAAQNNRYHSRTGSGRSSLGSGNRGQHGTMHSGRGYSNTSTPSNGHSPVESMGDLAEEDTPMPPDQYGEQGDYFQQSGGQGGSGSSGEEAGFGGVTGLPYRTETREQPPNKKTSDELQRRGSVDDRTMTMSAGRLFVANPDLSD
ncbi:hypothetical protein LTR78_000068 [Recurvomyces mirabilis]|uniref:Uncharacterized protein n=1 Tax=Recurvomyces mirabilis TaxID=574656 RepID=A0AAE0WWJ4_9PEZI|nr:hypothetical protein LTR78_000068 [Recurvomyces mirabilis]KAK5161724.1 hypothetical protein LTS14_000069 [Recurvomyces mirabilis]